MASTFTPDGTAGGAFLTEAGTYAKARMEVTTSAPNDEVSFGFTISRRPLYLRIGTGPGLQDLLADTEYGPGVHVESITPGVSPYYVEFQLREFGEATLSDFARIAPGELSLATPWLTDLRLLRSEQSSNVMWLCHPTREPRVLERRGPGSWSLRRFRPEDGPFEANETSGVTMAPSQRTGTVTITASEAVFATSDAGSLIRLTQAGQYKVIDASAVADATDPIEVTGAGASRSFFYEVIGTFVGAVVLQRSVGSDSNWVDVQSFTAATSGPVPLTDGLENQIVYYRWRMSAYTSGAATVSLLYSGGITHGVARIVSVSTDISVTADVIAAFAGIDPTSVWARGAWSDRLGWPAMVALYDGRLVFRRDNRRWHSKSDDFESFATGALDDDAISGTVPGKMNKPAWIKACERLMIGDEGGEGFIGAGEDDAVMTPANSRARIRTNRGSSQADAALVDGAPAFIQRAGRRLQLTRFSGGSYEIFDLTRLNAKAAGAPDGQFVELAYQVEPEHRLLAVRDDGQLVTCLLNIDERIVAITRWVPEGTAAGVESVAVIPGTPEDGVYLSVRRTVDGAVVRHIEKLAPETWAPVLIEDERYAATEAWRLQSASLYSGAATDEITGLDWLEGETVYAWANGRISGPHTVTSGAITLDFEATYAIVGLKYQGLYKGPRLGTLTANKKINRLGIVTLNTPAGLLSWGDSFDDMDTLKDRDTDGSYDTPLRIISADEQKPFAGRTDADSRVHVRFEGVGPATVAALVPDVTSGER